MLSSRNNINFTNMSTNVQKPNESCDANEEVDAATNSTHETSENKEVKFSTTTVLAKSTTSYQPLRSTLPVLSSILSNSPKIISNNNQLSRISVFERLARAETVAFIHQKVKSAVFNRSKRSSSEPPKLRSSSQHNANNNTRPTYRKETSTKSRRSIDNIINKSNTDFSGSRNITTPRPRTNSHNNVELSSSRHNTPHTFRSERDQQASFERLASRHTVASKMKLAQKSPTNVVTPPKPPQNLATRKREWKNKLKVSSNSSYNRWAASPSMEPSHNESFEDDFFDDIFGPYDTTILPTEIQFTNKSKLLFNDELDPSSGGKEIDPVEFNLSASFQDYEEDRISAKKLGADIMVALMTSELPPTAEWKLRKPLERELVMSIGELGYSYFIEQDCEEGGKTYSASATGSVLFIPDQSQIQVENYSCVHNFPS